MIVDNADPLARAISLDWLTTSWKNLRSEHAVYQTVTERMPLFARTMQLIKTAQAALPDQGKKFVLDASRWIYEELKDKTHPLSQEATKILGLQEKVIAPTSIEEEIYVSPGRMEQFVESGPEAVIGNDAVHTRMSEILHFWERALNPPIKQTHNLPAHQNMSSLAQEHYRQQRKLQN